MSESRSGCPIWGERDSANAHDVTIMLSMLQSKPRKSCMSFDLQEFVLKAQHATLKPNWNASETCSRAQNHQITPEKIKRSTTGNNIQVGETRIGRGRRTGFPQTGTAQLVHVELRAVGRTRAGSAKTCSNQARGCANTRRSPPI
jgi:hypothetical protein